MAATPDDVLFHRIRAFCCDRWKVAPPRFDAMVAAEELAAEDVLEALFCAAGTDRNLGGLRDYLFREQKVKRDREFDKVKALMVALRGAKESGRREEILQQLAALQRQKESAKKCR